MASYTAVESNTVFAINLWRLISAEKTKENIFFSPFSISAALSLLALGSVDETHQQLSKVLSYQDDKKFHETFGSLSNTLSKINSCKLQIANRLYARNDYTFKDEYLQSTIKYYDATSQNVDFSKTDETRKLINNWVSGCTNNKITDLLKEGTINGDTAMVLVNAIYFKGDWLDKFNSKHTRKDTFYMNKDENVQVEMMFKSENLMVAYNEEYKTKVCQIPYKGKDLSMYLFVPDVTGDHIKLEQNLSTALLQKLTSNLFEMQAEVYLPKFKAECELTNLTNDLQQLGLKDVFVRGQANLSQMDGTRNLFLSKVVHKAFIEVNEEGTEAAAATAGSIQLMCMPEIFEIRACKPFLFAIRHEPSQSFLFVGRIYKPTEVN